MSIEETIKISDEPCSCACCAEAVNREKHGRDPVDACSCKDYNENERCDCPFCLVEYCPECQHPIAEHKIAGCWHKDDATGLCICNETGRSSTLLAELAELKELVTLNKADTGGGCSTCGGKPVIFRNGDNWMCSNCIQDTVDELNASLLALDKKEQALQDIYNWTQAYPLEVFPEPDFKRVRELLEAGGITLDSVSASNMRHVVEGVAELVREGLSEKSNGG